MIVGLISTHCEGGFDNQQMFFFPMNMVLLLALLPPNTKNKQCGNVYPFYGVFHDNTHFKGMLNFNGMLNYARRIRVIREIIYSLRGILNQYLPLAREQSTMEKMIKMVSMKVKANNRLSKKLVEAILRRMKIDVIFPIIPKTPIII